jgi:hypothetical protein
MAGALESKHRATDDVGVQGLLSLVLLEGLAPVQGCEVEHPVLRPAREQAEQVSHVAERLDLVQSAAADFGPS